MVKWLEYKIVILKYCENNQCQIVKWIKLFKLADLEIF